MPNIRDVAAKADVHPSTVSRVFSGKAKISEKTRQRVLAAAEELGFQPNAIARSLSMKRTNTLAVVVPHVFDGYFEDCFFPQVMRGLLRVAYENEFRVLVSGSNSHRDEIEQTRQILGSRQADGIVVLSSRLEVDTAAVEALSDQRTPFIFLGQPPAEYRDIAWVDADNRLASRRAVEYLIQLGHQRIAFVGGDPDMLVTKKRLKGYQEALAAAALPGNPKWIDYGFFAEDGGFQAVQRMESLGDVSPTAYYAANDLMAIGIMRALRERGVQIPEEVSVMGTNGSPESTHVYPALSTVYVPYAEMAGQAAAVLIDCITGDRKLNSQNHVIHSSILVRDSTGPAPITTS